jgi:ribosomal protein S18 acetylase RimI-like enzyme
MDEHRPTEPHVYLWLLGTAPTAQGTGAGSALLAEVAAHAGADRLPVYLETMNPDNVSFYRSRGFHVLGQAPMPRGGHAWFMQRPAGAE